MKNKNNVFFALGLLVAVVIIGIGYALTTQELNINGSSSTTAIDSAFDVRFKNATPASDTETTSSTAGLVGTDNSMRTAEMSVSLTNVGESQSATFVIENNSQKGIGAKITPTNVKIYNSSKTNTFSSEFFEVSITGLDNEVTIPSITNNTYEFTVTVTLIKAFVEDTGTQHSENFIISLENITAVQE